MEPRLRSHIIGALLLAAGAAITSPAPAHAEFDRCRVVLQKAKLRWNELFKFRKNIVASFAMPAALKEFDHAQFESYRTRFGEMLAADEPIPFPRTFESELALVTAMIKHAEGDARRVDFDWRGLEDYRRRELHRAVKKLFSEKRVSRAAMQARVHDFYRGYLERFIPRIGEGLSPGTIETMMKKVSHARLLGTVMGDYFESAGLIRSASGFRNWIFQGTRGKEFTIAFSTLVNAHSVRQWASGAGLANGLAIPVVPRVDLLQWIDIPEPVLREAFALRSFDRAWPEVLQPYLTKNYPNLPKAAVVYGWVENAYSDLMYLYLFGFVGYAGYEAYAEYRRERALSEDLRDLSVKHQETVAADPDREEVKAHATEEVKNALWEDWKRQHPEEARNPNGEAYKSAHAVLVR